MLSKTLLRAALATSAIVCSLALAAPAGAAPKVVRPVGPLPATPPSRTATHHSGCTVTTHLPAVVGVDRSLKDIAMSLTFSGCPQPLYYGNSPAVAVYDPANAVSDYFDWTPEGGAQPVTESLIARRAGVYRAAEGYSDYYATDDPAATAIPVTWVYATTRVKFSTRSAMSATRKGSMLTFGGYIVRYSPNAYDFVGYAGKTVYLQKQTSRGWATIRTVHGTAAGRLTATYPSAAAGNYRWATPEATDTWPALSGVKHI